MPVLKVYKNGNWEELGGTSKIIVDDSWSESSTNPVQNKVIYEALSEMSSGFETVFGDLVYLDDKKVDKIDGYRLITPTEADKLEALTIDSSGQLGISGIVNADNVQGLDEKLALKADSNHTHSYNDLTNKPDFVDIEFMQEYSTNLKEYIDNEMVSFAEETKNYIDNEISNISSGKTLTEHLVEEDMILSSRQYGDTLPGEDGEPYTHVAGRIFFKRVSE